MNETTIRVLLAKHGGKFHGPRVEHLSMPETGFWAFMREVQIEYARAFCPIAHAKGEIISRVACPEVCPSCQAEAAEALAGDGFTPRKG